MNEVEEQLTSALQRRDAELTVHDDLDAIVNDDHIVRFNPQRDSRARRPILLTVAAASMLVAGAAGLIWAQQSTSAPTSTSPASLPPEDLVELTSDTPMLWANGVLVAAWVDEQFVPVAQTAGLPPELLGTPIELTTGGVGNLRSWTPETDECGTARLRGREDWGFPYGFRWSPSYPMSVIREEAGADQTLGAVGHDADLNAALNDLGVDPAWVFEYVPSEDLEGDPDVETIIVRPDPTTLIDDQRNTVWLAVWDPADVSIMTLAGDPETNDVHFQLLSRFADADANGLLDAAIDTGDDVTLFELSTGEILSSVTTPCPDPTG